MEEQPTLKFNRRLLGFCRSHRNKLIPLVQEQGETTNAQYYLPASEVKETILPSGTYIWERRGYKEVKIAHYILHDFLQQLKGGYYGTNLIYPYWFSNIPTNIIWENETT